MPTFYQSREELIPFKVCLNSCVDYFLRRGYHVVDETSDSLHMFKPGSIFATSIKNLPMELTLIVQNSETTLSLKYGTWVLFGTGGLRRELSKLANAIISNKEKLTITDQ